MGTDLEIANDSLSQIERGNTEIEHLVTILQVVDEGSHGYACKLERDIAAQEKLIKAEFEDPKRKAYEAHKAITALESKCLAPLSAAKAAIKTKIGLWRKNDAERKVQEARLAQEAARKAIEAARLEHAVELEAGGNPEMAAAVLERPVIPISIKPEAPVNKGGVSVREVWSVEVDNLLELVDWVSQDLKNRFQYLLPNQSALNGNASTTKSLFSIPGCRAVSRFS